MSSLNRRVAAQSQCHVGKRLTLGAMPPKVRMDSLEHDIVLWGTIPGSERHLPELAEELGSLGCDVHTIREGDGTYAGIEWALPTAFVLFIAAQYVSGLVQAAGADHYERLKTVLAKVLRRANQFNPTRVESRPRKLSEDPPGALSIHYLVEGRCSIKHVFDRALTEEEIVQTVTALIERLRDFNAGKLEAVVTAAEVDGWKVIYRFDNSTASWRRWDVKDEKFLE
jgi:hypothetical protein